MTLTSGTRLGAYEITGSVGAGGMGEVFRAKDSRLGRDVAVKVLPALFAGDPDRLRRFEQEARAAAALNHPNILVVYDVGTEGNVPFVVSELLEGQTLRQIIEKGPIAARKAADYGSQIANGLAAAHERGIVHRDLKPENVFITRDGRIKILDFGLAKLAEASSTDGSAATMAHTDPGMVVGTAGYMAPEQLRGEAVDARADVFSLGAVLYEMFCGQRAFKGKTAVDTMSAILREDPADFPPEVHASAPAIERIVRRCLEKNVHERFQSARDVTFALDALSSASGLKPAMGGDAADMPARRNLAMPIAIAVGAALLAGTPMYFAGARLGGRAVGSPTITQLTFRTGTIRGARFAPDGQTVLYAAAWEGQPIKTYSTRPGSPESTAMSVPDADLRAVSRQTGEMALTLGARVSNTFYTRGTLARAPISGGAPRLLLESVIQADFSPDGTTIAAVVRDPTQVLCSLQWPLGTERMSARAILSDVRISPDGEHAAFIAHGPNGDDGAVQVLDKSGPPRTLSAGWISVQGLAWSPTGKEIWFTGTKSGTLSELWGVTLDGRERLIYRSPVRLQLEDVAPDGRVLVSGVDMRAHVAAGSMREKTERDLSWFDYGTGVTISADGKMVAFTESGEGVASKYGIFVRPANGDPAVRVSDGGSASISPDAKSVMILGNDLHSLILVPTGAGAPRTLPFPKIERFTAAEWTRDSRRAMLIGNEPGRSNRTWELDVVNGSLTPITEEGTRGRLVSPDGQWLAVLKDGVPYAFNLRTKTLTPPAKGIEPTDGLYGWAPDSSSVFVGSAGRVFQVNLTTGSRVEVLNLNKQPPPGFVAFDSIVVAHDGDHYAYSETRQLSQLFMLKLPQ